MFVLKNLLKCCALEPFPSIKSPPSFFTEFLRQTCFAQSLWKAKPYKCNSTFYSQCPRAQDLTASGSHSVFALHNVGVKLNETGFIGGTAQTSVSDAHYGRVAVNSKFFCLFWPDSPQSSCLEAGGSFTYDITYTWASWQLDQGQSYSPDWRLNQMLLSLGNEASVAICPSQMERTPFREERTTCT